MKTQSEIENMKVSIENKMRELDFMIEQLKSSRCFIFNELNMLQKLKVQHDILEEILK